MVLPSAAHNKSGGVLRDPLAPALKNTGRNQHTVRAEKNWRNRQNKKEQKRQARVAKQVFGDAHLFAAVARAGDFLVEAAQRERELQRREEELMRKEKVLKQREGLVIMQQEQADAVVKVKRKALSLSETQAAKLESDLHARAAELAGLKNATVEQGAQLVQLQMQIQAIAGRMKEAEQELECPVCLDRRAETALNPCGHCFCCSEDCGSASVTFCPICRKEVDSRIRIFGAVVEPAEAISGEHLGAIAADLARAAAAVGGGGQYGADISRAGAATAVNDTRDADGGADELDLDPDSDEADDFDERLRRHDDANDYGDS